MNETDLREADSKVDDGPRDPGLHRRGRSSMLALVGHVVGQAGMSGSALRRVLSGVTRRLQGKPWPGVELDAPSLRLGTEYGGYAVLSGAVGPDSIVYSLGLGEDISFDLALIAQTSCHVYGFDPTPRSIAWVKAQNPPPKLHVHELGVAGYDGQASFTPPRDPSHISHSMSPSTGDAGRVEFEVRKLSTLMRELGHERLDLLKMDVEGAEYEVLDDLLASGSLPGQLLVEFHHGMYGIPLAKTEATLGKLRAAGYRIFDAQPTGREFSLALNARARAGRSHATCSARTPYR